MPSYCAFLGHQPRISLAELSSVLPGFSVLRMIRNGVAVFSTTEEVDPKALDTWGGTMLIAEELDVKGDNGFANVPKAVADLLLPMKGKVTFSLRTDGVHADVTRRLYRDTKAELKKGGKPSRYVGTEKAPAATILLHELELFSGKHGAEIVLLKDDDWTWVGRAIAAHNPNAYTKRDMHKPARDTTVGLLPPKLAQVMLNFAAWTKDSMKKDGEKKSKKRAPLVVYDPFCGSGVILMEALLRGWPVYGSDSSQRAVNGTETNLDWLRKEEKILKKDVPSQIVKHDATKPFEFKEKPDIVVSETTLGEALTRRASLKEIQSHKSFAEKIEAGFIENAAKTLSGVPIVCTFPVWMSSTGPVFLEKIWNVITECGYELVLPPGMSTDVAVHKSLLYRRPDQFVGRQIVFLRPKQ